MVESAHGKKQFWRRHLRERGYFCCSSGNVTDEIVAKHIASQNVNEGQDEDFKVDS
jgi:REP element-mobilizing transposase RayT